MPAPDLLTEEAAAALLSAGPGATVHCRYSWLMEVIIRPAVRTALLHASLPLSIAKLGCPDCIHLVAVSDDAITSDWEVQ